MCLAGVMELHPRSPLVAISASWLLGLLCAPAMDRGAWQGAVALAAFAVAASMTTLGFLDAASPVRPASKRLLWLGCLATFAAGVTSARPDVPRALVPAGMARVRVLVEDTRPRAEDRSRSFVRVLSGARIEDGAAVPEGSLLSAAPVPLPRGATVLLLAKVEPRSPFRNPSPHPRAPPRFEIQGSAWIAGPAAVRILHQAPGSALLELARTRVRAAIDASLPSSVSGITRARARR